MTLYLYENNNIMGLIDDENFKRVLKRSLREEEDEKNDEKQSENGGSFKQIVEKLLHSRNQIHIFHLQTKSYAEHIVLNDYYDGILPLFDGLVESYQGKNNIITNYQCDGFDDYSSGEQVIKYLKDMAEDIQKLREPIKESYLQNQIDTVDELIYSTLNKLRFLK